MWRLTELSACGPGLRGVCGSGSCDGVQDCRTPSVCVSTATAVITLSLVACLITPRLIKHYEMRWDKQPARIQSHVEKNSSGNKCQPMTVLALSIDNVTHSCLECYNTWLIDKSYVFILEMIRLTRYCSFSRQQMMGILRPPSSCKGSLPKKWLNLL